MVSVRLSSEVKVQKGDHMAKQKKSVRRGRKPQTGYQQLFNRVASLIAEREGKKSQVKIGDVREILRIVVDDAVMPQGNVTLLSLMALLSMSKKFGVALPEDPMARAREMAEILIKRSAGKWELERK